MNCGQSDSRNKEYFEKFNEVDYFKYLVKSAEPIIFDVGGHKGESVAFFKNIFPNGLIHTFEPNPENSKHLPKDNSIIVNNLALSDFNGKSNFYTQSITHLGSLYPINVESKDSLGFASKADNKQISVDVLRGDYYMESHGISKIDLLKIDVQGAEVEVLKGFEQKLNDILVVSCEIELYDFYQKKSSIFAVESVLNEYFELYDILKISKNPKNFRTDWIEAVYINKNVKLNESI